MMGIFKNYFLTFYVLNQWEWKSPQGITINLRGHRMIYWKVNLNFVFTKLCFATFPLMDTFISSKCFITTFLNEARKITLELMVARLK